MHDPTDDDIGCGGEYLLEMLGIGKEFPGVRALDSANLCVRPGTVHALMGENGAGKSTLMRCLFGVYAKDAGRILLAGREVNFDSPRQALDGGVAMVHQELEQMPHRSVMENIWLGRFPRRLGGLVLNKKKMYRDTRAIFDELEITVDPREKIGDLSVSVRQMVEIAKAVSYESRVLVLDEPTSSLTDNEVEQLFRIIGKLKLRGCGIVYISHKMEEILRVSDEVTVMRDGRTVCCNCAADMTIDKIISYMVGRDLEHMYPPKDNVPGEVLLRVENLNSYYAPRVHNASFELRAGEILGVAGLVGARRTELLETIYGIRRRDGGEVYLRGKRLKITDARSAIKSGLALVTEERRATGIFPLLSVRVNSIIANLAAYRGRLGRLRQRSMARDCEWVVDKLGVKTPTQQTLIRALSGGNQQKVILGRWLLTRPEVLMLDEPTRGIDVGAKYEIYQLIIDLAKQDKAIIMVSSEMPELLGVADRILVMSNGRIAGIVDAKTTTQEEIMRLSAMYLSRPRSDN